MSGSRLILLILIVLVVLFVVGLGMRVGNNTQSVDPEKSTLLQVLKEKFIKEEPLNARDISANCFNKSTFIIPVSSTCRSEIREAETRVRTMKLRIIEGDRVQVKLDPKGENAIPVSITLRSTSSKPLTLQIFKGREQLPVVATLSLTCESASGAQARCSVQLQ